MSNRFLFLIALFLAAPALHGQTTRPTTRPLRFEMPDQPAIKVRNNGATDTGFMRQHNQYLALAKKGDIDLYMEGDSITDFWEHNATHRANWDKNFAGWKVGDFGISGDRTQHVLWRIENGELDGVTPKVIVLLIGTNNLPSNTVYTENTVEGTFKGYQAIVAKLREEQPQAHILLIAVFPREDKPLKDKIDQLNSMIATLADGDQIKYLNFNDQLADKDGHLFPGVMGRDHLHPADKGYDIWAAAMRPILTQWLGPPAATQPAAN